MQKYLKSEVAKLLTQKGTHKTLDYSNAIHEKYLFNYYILNMLSATAATATATIHSLAK